MGMLLKMIAVARARVLGMCPADADYGLISSIVLRHESECSRERLGLREALTKAVNPEIIKSMDHPTLGRRWSIKWI